MGTFDHRSELKKIKMEIEPIVSLENLSPKTFSSLKEEQKKEVIAGGFLKFYYNFFFTRVILFSTLLRGLYCALPSYQERRREY